MLLHDVVAWCTPSIGSWLSSSVFILPDLPGRGRDQAFRIRSRIEVGGWIVSSKPRQDKGCFLSFFLVFSFTSLVLSVEVEGVGRRAVRLLQSCGPTFDVQGTPVIRHRRVRGHYLSERFLRCYIVHGLCGLFIIIHSPVGELLSSVPGDISLYV